jgi:hypothetical protein
MTRTLSSSSTSPTASEIRRSRCADLTRLQRASQGSRKSTGCCRDNVVKGGSVGFEHVRWNFIMFCNCAVYPEDHWLRLGGQVSSADWTFHALDANVGTIHDFRHQASTDGGSVPWYSSAIKLPGQRPSMRATAAYRRFCSSPACCIKKGDEMFGWRHRGRIARLAGGVKG